MCRKCQDTEFPNVQMPTIIKRAAYSVVMNSTELSFCKVHTAEISKNLRKPCKLACYLQQAFIEDKKLLMQVHLQTKCALQADKVQETSFINLCSNLEEK